MPEINQTRGDASVGSDGTDLQELDRLIAEKVTGWKWPSGRCPVCGWTLVQHLRAGCIPGNCCQRPTPERRADEIPHYSADLVSAWPVVEKMRERGFHFLLMATHESRLCIASFYLGPQDRIDSSRTNESAPVAICRAALAALEVERAQ